MARIVPDSVFRRGSRQREYKRDAKSRTLDQWTSPEGVATAWKLTDSVGGVINAAVQEKKGRDKILSEMDSTGKMIQLNRLAESQGTPENVLKLQNALAEAGFDLPKSRKPDGSFDAAMGPETRGAMDRFKARQKGRLRMDPSQLSQYATLQDRAGGRLDRLVSGAGSLVGHDASELEFKRQQAAQSRVQALQDQALAANSAALGYDMAAGAETMAEREAATNMSLNAFDRTRAATLSGQASNQGQAAIAQNLQRLFPGRAPQKREPRKYMGPGHKKDRVREPHRLFNAVHGGKTNQGLNRIASLKRNPKDANYVTPLTADDVRSTKIPDGTLALTPTKEQKDRMKLGDAARVEVLGELINGYQQSMALAKHPMLDTAIRLMAKSQRNLTIAQQRSAYATVDDELFRAAVGDPFAALMASGAPPGAILEQLKNNASMLESMESYKDSSVPVQTVLPVQDEPEKIDPLEPDQKESGMQQDQKEPASLEDEVANAKDSPLSIGDLFNKLKDAASAPTEPTEKVKAVPAVPAKPKRGSAEHAAGLKPYDRGTRSKRQIEEDKKKKAARKKRRANRGPLVLEGDNQTREQKLEAQSRRLAAQGQPKAGSTRARGVAPAEQERASGSAAERKARTAEANKSSKAVNRRKEVAKQVRSLMGRLPKTTFNPRTKAGRGKIREFKVWATKTLMANDNAETFKKVKTAASKGQF